MTCLLRALRSRADERGFTLTEVMVGLIVLSVGIFGTGRVFLGSLQAEGVAASRAQATSLATRETEAMHAVPFASLGMIPGTMSDSVYEGLSVVYTTPGSTAASGPSTTLAGTTFSITRRIVWISQSPNPTAYKRTTVVVSWTDRAGTHQVRQDAEVYPGGLGTYGATTTTSSTTTTTAPLSLCTPAGLGAVPDSLVPTTQVDLSWSCPGTVPQYWEIQHALDAAFTNALTEDTANQPGTSTAYTRSALASNTTYYFRIRGITGAVTGSWANFPAVHTGEDETCTLGSPNATPSAVRRSGNSGNLASDVGISVHSAIGDHCGVLTLLFKPDGVSQQSITLALNSGTGVYSTTIYGNNNAYNWSVGSHPLAVVNGVGTQMGSISLVVCSHNASSCP